MLKGQGEGEAKDLRAITQYSGIGSTPSGDSTDNIILFNTGSVLVHECHLATECMAPIRAKLKECDSKS
jgi:hypothetical protein